jgi:hypothetical protein
MPHNTKKQTHNNKQLHPVLGTTPPHQVGARSRDVERLALCAQEVDDARRHRGGHKHRGRGQAVQPQARRLENKLHGEERAGHGRVEGGRHACGRRTCGVEGGGIFIFHFSYFTRGLGLGTGVVARGCATAVPSARGHGSSSPVKTQAAMTAATRVRTRSRPRRHEHALPALGKALGREHGSRVGAQLHGRRLGAWRGKK